MVVRAPACALASCVSLRYMRNVSMLPFGPLPRNVLRYSHEPNGSHLQPDSPVGDFAANTRGQLLVGRERIIATGSGRRARAWNEALVCPS